MQNIKHFPLSFFFVSFITLPTFNKSNQTQKSS